jgi:hypothetical protein
MVKTIQYMYVQAAKDIKKTPPKKKQGKNAGTAYKK